MFSVLRFKLCYQNDIAIKKKAVVFCCHNFIKQACIFSVLNVHIESIVK